MPAASRGHTMTSMPTAMIDIQLVNRPITPEIKSFEALVAGVGGGECVFLGRTRIDSHPEHGQLLRLDYEAYASMAETVLRDLAKQAVESFGCMAVRVHHALGEVPPGEVSVMVQVVCGHRDKAFAACRFLIDELKAKAPIWKREQWADESTWSAGQVVKT